MKIGIVILGIFAILFAGVVSYLGKPADERVPYSDEFIRNVAYVIQLCFMVTTIVMFTMCVKKIENVEAIVSDINARYVSPVAIEDTNVSSIADETKETTSESIPVTEVEADVKDLYIPEETEEETVEESVEELPSELEPDPVVNVDPGERELLACVIFQEAGGDNQCDECRRRVADVVLNRVNDPSFPNTIWEVLTQNGQYGKFSTTGVCWPERAHTKAEQHAVNRAYRIAEEVLSGNHSELYGKGYIWQATFKQGDDNVYCCGHYYGR